MARLETGTGRTARTPLRAPLLTSRRHIDLQRVCSAISRHL
ncbi:putative leader peptide [Streptomyces naphthomycinicus]|nr:putative leader peptide [Streptomyces sp. TML10]